MRSLYTVEAGGKDSIRTQRHICLTYRGAFALLVKESIDLTLDTPLPNDPTYRFSIMENEELSFQIQEIIRRTTLDQAPHLVGAQLFWYMVTYY
jgi:hypothetical protein